MAQKLAAGADKLKENLNEACGKAKGTAVSLCPDGKTLKKVAYVTSFLPGIGHSQAVYAKYEGDDERATKYATRATGATVAVGATMATGGLAVWGGLVGGAMSGVAVASGAGAVGTTAGLATRRAVEAVSWNYTDDPEVARKSKAEILTEVAVGSAAGAFAGTLPGGTLPGSFFGALPAASFAGKELGMQAVGQGGYGTQVGAFLGEQSGVQSAVKQGTTMAGKMVAKHGLQSCAGNRELTLEENVWRKIAVSAIIQSEAFQQHKATHCLWKFEITKTSGAYIRNDIDGWLDIGDFRYVVLKHSFDYSHVIVQATPLSQCSTLGSRMWRAATYNPLHHAAKVGLHAGTSSVLIATIDVVGIDVNIFASNS